MAEPNLAAAITALIIAYQSARDLLQSIRLLDNHWQKGFDEVVREQKLMDALNAGENELSARYSTIYNELGEQYRMGDGISQHKLFQTAQLVNSKIVKSLQIAIKLDNAQINYDRLTQDAILFKRAALGILEELRSLFLPVRLTFDDVEEPLPSDLFYEAPPPAYSEEVVAGSHHPGHETGLQTASPCKEKAEATQSRPFSWESTASSSLKRLLSKRMSRSQPCLPDIQTESTDQKHQRSRSSEKSWYDSADILMVSDSTTPPVRRDSPTLGAWEKWRQSDHLVTSHANANHTRNSSEYSCLDRASLRYSVYNSTTAMRHPALDTDKEVVMEEPEVDLDDDLDDFDDDFEDLFEDDEISTRSARNSQAGSSKAHRGSSKKVASFFGEVPPDNKGFHKKRLKNFFGEDLPAREVCSKTRSTSSLDDSLTSMSRTSSHIDAIEVSTPLTSPTSLADSGEWAEVEGSIPKGPIYELYAPPSPSLPPSIPPRSPLRSNTSNPSCSSTSSALSTVSSYAASTAPSSAPSSTSSRNVSISPLMARAPPSKANNYHGFCKDAWVMRKSIDEGLKLQSRPAGMYTKSSFFQCRSCSFQSPQLPPRSIAMDQKVYASAGILYRWSFLAKSHVKCKSGHERSYGCMFCIGEGLPGQIHGSIDTLMGHIVTEHSAHMSLEVQKETNCVFGRIAQAHEEFDICVPVTLAQGPVFTPVTEEFGVH